MRRICSSDGFLIDPLSFLYGLFPPREAAWVSHPTSILLFFPSIPSPLKGPLKGCSEWREGKSELNVGQLTVHTAGSKCQGCKCHPPSAQSLSVAGDWGQGRLSVGVMDADDGPDRDLSWVYDAGRNSSRSR